MDEILIDCMEEDFDMRIQSSSTSAPLPVASYVSTNVSLNAPSKLNASLNIPSNAPPHVSLNATANTSFSATSNTTSTTQSTAWNQSKSSDRHKLTGNGTRVSYDSTDTNGKTESAQEKGGYVHQPSQKSDQDLTRSAVLDIIQTEDRFSKNGRNQMRTGSLEDSNAQNIIMMYSPDIPSARCGYRSEDSNLGSYYVLIETEESVKCIVSTVLFLVILVAMFLVACLKNPEM